MELIDSIVGNGLLILQSWTGHRLFTIEIFPEIGKNNLKVVPSIFFVSLKGILTGQMDWGKFHSQWISSESIGGSRG